MNLVRLGLFGLLVAAAPATAADVLYHVANDSGLTIMELYTSPMGEGACGEDLLHVSVLPQGEVIALLIPDGGTRCDRDLRFVFETGQAIVRATNVREVTNYTVQGVP